jgi:hypothetical protein
VTAGGRIDAESAPSLLRLAAALYTLQLTFFLVQETIEGSPTGQLLLWGLLGQLPVAFIGAAALRWLFARVRPALASLHSMASRPLVLEVGPLAVARLRFAPARARALDGQARAVNLRGPPTARLY